MDTINKLPNWFRWLLILPAFIITYILVRFVGIVSLNWYQGGVSRGILYLLCYCYIEGGAAIACALWICKLLAPTRKNATVVVLSILTVLMVMFTFTGFFVYGYSYDGRYDTASFILTSIFTVCSCLWTCYAVGKEKENVEDEH